jgi:hypothetical protein
MFSKSRPVLGHQNGVSGVGRIIFYAYDVSLRGQRNVDENSGQFLRGLVANAGNGIAIQDQPADRRRSGSCNGRMEKRSAARSRRIGLAFHNFEKLGLRDAADPVHVFAPPALGFLRISSAESPQPQPQPTGTQGASCRARVYPLEPGQRQRPLFGAVGSTISPSDSRAFAQSFRNVSNPRSVSGCWKSCSNTL